MAYNRDFFDQMSDGSLRSARQIVPVMLELVRPASVIDVGCGVGSWLKAFSEAGVGDVLGVDGSYVPRDKLQIPATAFRDADLTQPLDLGRRFDLALSLEVGEHLPEVSAPALIDTLVRLAPVVVFSAAVPFQGGTTHVNEQWPDYWAELFKAKGYVVVDALRPRVWRNENIEPYYRQNLLLFVDERELARYPGLAEARLRTAHDMLSVVHPAIFKGRNRYPLGPLPGLFAWILRRAVSSLFAAFKK